MNKKRIILGIESSCDETSVSIVRETSANAQEILSNIVNSQTKLHEKSGGVIPEIAARSHSMVIDKLIDQALLKAKASFLVVESSVAIVAVVLDVAVTVCVPEALATV